MPLAQRRALLLGPALLHVGVVDAEGDDLAGQSGDLAHHSPRFFHSGMPRQASSRSILGWGGALVVSPCCVAPLGVAGQLRRRRRQARAALLTVGS